MVYQLAYLSTTGDPWDRARLVDLLRQARVRNEQRGVTGILLFRNGSFVQLLEGGRAEVDALFDLIRADPRHDGVTRIWEAERASRWFPDWTMAFRDLEEDPVTEPGLRDVLRGPVDASVFSHEVVLQLWMLLRAPVTPRR